jgi:hypothetical protein
MRTIISALYLLILTASTGFAQSPLFPGIYTADPSARVFNDTLYVYTSHDKEDAKWFNMEDWHVFSTTDLIHWQHHGSIFSLEDISWAASLAWAPDAAHKNGRYYFYFPVEKKYIGVAESMRPEGPFTDALGTPLITLETPGVVTGRGLIDPCIFLDKGQNPYLIFGQSHVNIVRLNDDMISLKDTVQIIKGAKHFFEGAWMHEHAGKYYLSYAGRPGLLGRAKIYYCMGDQPVGPFDYKGVILGKVNSGTSHASIVQYQGKWHLFFHNSELFFQNDPKAGKKSRQRWYRRSVTMHELEYDETGAIRKVSPQK